MVSKEILRKTDVFVGLTDEQLESVAAIAQEEVYEPGAIIFSEHDIAKNLYIVEDGRVAVQIPVDKHRRATIHTVTNGLTFGWSALVEPYRFTASARCVEPSRVITIDGAELGKLFEGDCRMGFIVMSRIAMIISGRLRDTMLQLISLQG
ncbi:MAG: cyclic nucleotide-binding domain-containing protein [Chloroflexi bacterium]|nr:cyclic nucleotide-binding domain-containing protein [Chloroflexota bacterium]MCL5075443.1 cyclic nucleotide-binding domain-containing protein [Chloroflexota bacterium]